MTKIYRGAGGKFASKAEIAAQKALESPQTQPPARVEVKAFKGFNVNDKGELYCKDHVFEVGKEYDKTGQTNGYSSTKRKTAQLCHFGFHACENPFDVFRYYPFSDKTIYGKVTLFGHIDHPKKYDLRDKIAGIGIRVDETYNIYHLINGLIRFALDNPDKIPTYGSVRVNDNTINDAKFQLSNSYDVRELHSKSATPYCMQMSNTERATLVSSSLCIQVTSKELSTLIGGKNSNQYSYGQSSTHIVKENSNIVVMGQNSQILATGPLTMKGPKGTRFTIAEAVDNWGRKIPGISGVMGENDIPADKEITYRLAHEHITKAKLIF